MKKIFTLLSATFLSMAVFAYGPQTKLTVSNNTKNPVTIIVDGKAQGNSRYGDDELVINNLNAGYHTVRVYQKSVSNRNRGNAAQLVYDGNIYIKPQYHVDISINRFGKAFIDERQMTRELYGDDYDDRDNQQARPTRNPIFNGSQNQGNNYKQAMDSRSFDQLKYSISSSTYDNTKMAIAKQAISQNYFTTAQVKELLQLFTYEASRLDLAKYAFSRATDPGNYFSVNDVFTYSSSKEELSRYIQQNRF